MGSDGDNHTEVVVVMVPFVTHGHLNQLLRLSHLISSYNIPVHFATTTTHSRQLSTRHHHFRPNSNLIHFHELPTPSFASRPPDPSQRFPGHQQPAFDATLHLRCPVADLIRSLSTTTKRVAVVHDFLTSYVVQDVKHIPNAETYLFNPLSAFDTFWRTWEERGRPFPVDEEMLRRIPMSDNELFSTEFLNFIMIQYPHVGFHVGELFDSSRAIEGEYLELLERRELIGKTKIWAIGPLNHVDKAFVTVSSDRHKCLQWLDLQPPNSVIYVSFGTSSTFSDKQIKELAMGLEKSRKRFVWVVRAADKADVAGEETKMVDLPDGFEATVEGRGLVLRGWAPQIEILGHRATGGFMSHCGWNSTSESISMGLPMIAWPMHSDQPRNAIFVTDVLRVGLAVMDWEHRNELVTSAVVVDSIRRLFDTKEGEEMRKRMAGLAYRVQRSITEGGVSRKETDSLVSYIKRET